MGMTDHLQAALTTTRRRIWAALRWLPTVAWRWWTGLEPPERVLYRAVVLLGVGFAMIVLPLGLIVAGLLFAAVFFGFSLRRA